MYGRHKTPPRPTDQETRQHLEALQDIISALFGVSADRLYGFGHIANPHLTLQELASFAGIRTREGARRIWKTSLQALWVTSPPELQVRYPLAGC
jgi:hypothetical protein